MINLTKFTFIFLTSLLIFAGCSEKQSELEIEEQSIYVDPEFDGAPKWIHKPHIDNKISEIGSAANNAGNDFALQREEAISNARDNIARRINIKVNNMFKTYKGTTGIKENGTFDKVIETVSKQISSQTLKNSIVEDLWISKTKTMYVLVSINTEKIRKVVKNSVKTSFQNDEALHQKYLAQDAQGKLDLMIKSLEE